MINIIRPQERLFQSSIVKKVKSMSYQSYFCEASLVSQVLFLKRGFNDLILQEVKVEDIVMVNLWRY